MDSNRWRYRPELDGLRALAVLAVIALHAGLGLAHGGGIGVDLFFVLSGFLITSLLVSEHESTGRIALGRFFARRALRLMPALVGLLVATIGLSLLASSRLTPDFHVSAVLSASAVAGSYSSDIWVADAGHTIGPFLHTWSLSIEEHFYIIWACALAIALARGVRRERLSAILVVYMALVFGWRLVSWRVSHNVAHLAYAFDTQSDELAIGCMLGLNASRLRRTAARDAARGFFARAAAPLGSLVLAGLIVRPFTPSQLAFGGYLVIALASAALVGSLVIVDGSIARVLRLPPLVYVGRLSYSLYLWHFVIFHAVTATFLGTGYATSAVARVLLTFAVASASYHLIERPALRLKSRLRGRRITGLALAVAEST